MDLFWIRFWRPRTLKIEVSAEEELCFFCDFAFFNPDSIWDPILDPPGLRLGVFWPPRQLKPVLRFFLERPRAARRIFFSAPEGSKGAPRGPEEASSLPGQLQKLSKRRQDRFWSNLGVIWGAVLGLFWNNLGTSLITGRRQMITRT